MTDVQCIRIAIDDMPATAIIEISDITGALVWEVVSIYIYVSTSFFVKSKKTMLIEIWSNTGGGIIKDSVVRDVIKQITPEADAIVKQMEDKDGE